MPGAFPETNEAVTENVPKPSSKVVSLKKLKEAMRLDLRAKVSQGVYTVGVDSARLIAQGAMQALQRNFPTPPPGLPRADDSMPGAFPGEETTTPPPTETREVTEKQV